MTQAARLEHTLELVIYGEGVRFQVGSAEATVQSPTISLVTNTKQTPG